MTSSSPVIRYATSFRDFDGNIGLHKIPDTINILRGTIESANFILNTTEFNLALNDTELNVERNASLIVFGEACGRDRGLRNCTMACEDPSSLFASWEGLWTCLTLASVATVWPSLSKSSEVETAISVAVNDLDGSDISTFDGDRVFNLVQSCAAASCQEGECEVEYPVSNESSRYLQTVFDTVKPVCDGIQVRVSNDISGPGVIVSYIIQTILSLFSSVSIALVAFSRAYAKQRPSQHPQEKNDTLPRRACSRLAHAPSTLLAEFQEAQCFFVVAVAVAQLFANSQGADFNDTDDLASLLFQHNNVVTLATVGIQCIALTQAGLRRARLTVVYTLVWATLAVALAGAASGTVMMSNAELVNLFIRGGKDGSEPEECGGKFSLRELCIDETRVSDSAGMFMHAGIMAGIVLGFLWLETVWPLLLRTA